MDTLQQSVTHCMCYFSSPVQLCLLLVENCVSQSPECAVCVRKGRVFEENVSYCGVLQMKLDDTDSRVVMGECSVWKIFGPQI